MSASKFDQKSKPCMRARSHPAPSLDTAHDLCVVSHVCIAAILPFCAAAAGARFKSLHAEARKRRLSEGSYADVSGDGEGIKYGYVLAELFASPRHTRVPFEVRAEQLLVIAAHFGSAMRTWEPGDAIDEPPFVRRGTVVGRGALREVSAAEAHAATPALSRRSAGQSTPAVRLRPAIVEAGSGSNAAAAAHGALYREAVEGLAALLGQYEDPEEAKSRLDAEHRFLVAAVSRLESGGRHAPPARLQGRPGCVGQALQGRGQIALSLRAGRARHMYMWWVSNVLSYIRVSKIEGPASGSARDSTRGRPRTGHGAPGCAVCSLPAAPYRPTLFCDICSAQLGVGATPSLHNRRSEAHRRC